MKKLERSEMKKVRGGVGAPVVSYHIPGLIGWVGGESAGYCLCDFYNVAGSGNVICGVPCPISMCTSGSLDPNPYGL